MSIETAERGSRRFERFAAAILVYLLCVIVFGAWVRVTGSGAGCGEHWPSCNGVLIPRSPSQQTLIEYTHRISSGLLGLASLALPVWAFLRFPSGHMARHASLVTFVLVLVEAAIGARLVLAGLVADNASLARAVAVALHLVNTLLLTASATLTLATARGSERAPHPANAVAAGDMTDVSSPAARCLILLFLGALVLVSASGAVTALGDTLFPVRDDAAPLPDHFLVQLRVVHPVLACGAVLLGLAVARRFAGSAPARPLARFVGATALAQLALGGINVALRAPGWLQLVHLLCAQLLWIGGVLLAFSSLCAKTQAASPVLGPSALP